MNIYWLCAIIFGVGLFLLVFSLLSGLAEAISWRLFRRQQRLLVFLSGSRAKPVQTQSDDILGLGRIPWVQIYILPFAAGLGILSRSSLWRCPWPSFRLQCGPG